jgi:hypothetical protein
VGKSHDAQQQVEQMMMTLTIKKRSDGAELSV